MNIARTHAQYNACAGVPKCIHTSFNVEGLVSTRLET